MGFGKVVKKSTKFMNKTVNHINHIRKTINSVVDLIPPELLLSTMV